MKKQISLITSAMLACAATFSSMVFDRASAVVAQPAETRRLPANVVPISYDLSFAPDLQTGTFKGEETLHITVTAGGAASILLNSRDLSIEQPHLLSDTAGDIPVQLQDLPQEAMIDLKPSQPLNAGNYKLQLKFSGKLNDKLVGFYRSTFKDSSGHEHIIAATQMEPTDARRMFPCFDEPAFKASFRLTVRVARGLSAVTNAALDRKTENNDGTTTFYFGITPRMSSYLVALIVGELGATAPVTVGGVSICVWSVAGQSRLGTYSRDEAAKILPVLTAYFGIPYPWRKLDLIAIPDFEAGAMENPGAITFRQTLLLIDPSTASSRAKRAACEVIAHEMSHMWFGDLVTMKWWDDLWLNEAFATWMAIKAVDKVHPDWDEWKEYALARSRSMETDGLKSTRPIHFTVTNPEQAHEMFDIITYDKGCSVLRMLERYATEKKFQEGVHAYLTRHSFGNATTADLWEAIGTASDTPVADIMHGWVHQPGYPLVLLSSSPQGGYAVTQRRFLESGEEQSGGSLWQIPLCSRVVSGPVPQNQPSQADRRLLIEAAAGTLPAPMKSDANMLVFANAGGVGYYRTLYPQPLYRQILKDIETNLDPCERLALLDDTWNLVQSGNEDIHSYLSLLTNLRSEKDELVGEAIVGQLRYLDAYVESDERPAFEKLVRAQLHHLYETLGWETQAGETQQTRMLRGTVLSALGTIGNDKQIIEKARQLFTRLAAAEPGTTGGIDPDLLPPVTAIIAYNGDRHDFALIKQRYGQALTPEEENRNLMALAEFKPDNVVEQVMSMAIDGSVRTQDAPGLLSRLMSRRDTNERAWDFVEKHWQRITDFYPEEMVPHVVSHASSFNNAADVDRVKQFLASHRIPSGESTVARTIERMDINVRFKNRCGAQFNQWLKQNYGNV